MKIKMLKGIASRYFVMKKGGVYNIPINEAKTYIKAGYASVVTEEVEQHKIHYDTAVLKAKTDAVQNSNSTDNLSNKSDGGKIAYQGKLNRGRKSNNSVNKKRNKLG